MYLIKICFILFLTAGQISQDDLTKKNSTPIVSNDTIQYLKKRSQILLSEEKYQEVYRIFSYLADFYSSKNDLRLFFDYKNKAANCLSKFGDRKTSLDSLFLLFKKYDISNLNDTTLTASITKSFITNYTIIQDYPVKLKYLDFLIDSTNCEIPLTSRLLLSKHRLEITNKLSIINEQLKSYYDLLNQKLSLKDEIKFEID
ncbi:MAG: hypothetical protein D4R64_10205, partial [Porphyromonadaceae bacterium]